MFKKYNYLSKVIIIAMFILLVDFSYASGVVGVAGTAAIFSTILIGLFIYVLVAIAVVTAAYKKSKGAGNKTLLFSILAPIIFLFFLFNL